jgi:hypothetical protein
MPIGNPVTLTSNVASKTLSQIATAGQTLFTVPGGYRLNYIAVFRNGVKLAEGRDYSARDAVSVTLFSPSTEYDVIEFEIFDTFRSSDAANTNDDLVNFVGDVTIQGDLQVIGVTTIAGAATSVALATTAYGLTAIASVNTSGIITASAFSGPLTGNVTGDATGLSGSPNIVVNNVVGTSATFSNLTVNGTQTILNTTVLDIADKTVGVGSTSTPSNTTANGAGVVIYGGSDGDKTLTWQSNSDDFTFSHGIDIKGAVETVSVATTSPDVTAGKVVLTCNAQNGTVFTHDLANGVVGIVSLTNFPVTKNSATTFTIIFTQNATGTANTTAATGIGTNIYLKPYNVTGFSTSALVSTASTVTLSTTASDVDFVSLMVHYNGSGTALPTSYKVFGTNNNGFRLGNIRP